MLSFPPPLCLPFCQPSPSSSSFILAYPGCQWWHSLVHHNREGDRRIQKPGCSSACSSYLSLYFTYSIPSLGLPYLYWSGWMQLGSLDLCRLAGCCRCFLHHPRNWHVWFFHSRMGASLLLQQNLGSLHLLLLHRRCSGSESLISRVLSHGRCWILFIHVLNLNY